MGGTFSSMEMLAKLWLRAGTTEQREAAIIYVRATAGIFGCLLFWVGLWDLFTEGRVGHRLEDHSIDEDFFLDHYQRTLLYIGLGYVLSVWTDSITFQAGCWSHLWHPNLWCVSAGQHALILRWVLGAGGMFMLWIGLNDVFDYYVGTPGTTRDVIYLVAGLIGVGATGTFEHLSYIYSIEAEEEDVPTYKSPLSTRLYELVRCSIAILAQALFWLSTWNLLHLDRFVCRLDAASLSFSVDQRHRCVWLDHNRTVYL